MDLKNNLLKQKIKKSLTSKNSGPNLAGSNVLQVNRRKAGHLEGAGN
jgi:hypothetical protein